MHARRADHVGWSDTALPNLCILTVLGTSRRLRPYARRSSASRSSLARRRQPPPVLLNRRARPLDSCRSRTRRAVCPPGRDVTLSAI
jgi:hypothetical protein